jgi:hypothetical protein
MRRGCSSSICKNRDPKELLDPVEFTVNITKWGNYAKYGFDGVLGLDACSYISCAMLAQLQLVSWYNAVVEVKDGKGKLKTDLV